MILKKVQINFCELDSAADVLVETVRGRILLNEEKEYRIKLVCKELLTNILTYSDARGILLSVALSAGNLTITIEDDGSGFSHEDAMRQDCRQGASLMRENGRGIYLVRMMAEKVEYNEKGNAVTVTLDLS